MSIAEEAVAMLEEPDTLDFEVSDVTGTHQLMATGVQRAVSAGAVAHSLAASMKLPDNVPWALRDETTSAFLEDDRPIGEQLRRGAKVVVTPKAHLG
jgi:hypothetical protein